MDDGYPEPLMASPALNTSGPVPPGLAKASIHPAARISSVDKDWHVVNGVSFHQCSGGALAVTRGPALLMAAEEA